MAQRPLLGGGRLVCVDGPAGSGKTTFAESFSAHVFSVGLTAHVVHLDDVYAGWDQDLAAVGPQLRNHLIGPAASGHVGRYRRFDWHQNKFVDWVDVPKCEVLIVEGVGSGHWQIKSRRAALILLEADQPTRLARGIARDGEALRAEWLVWQQREAAYLSAYDVAHEADFRFSTQT